MPTADPAPFASAGDLIRRALASYLPVARINVADHAAAHRWLENRGGGYVGRWNHDEAPYLVRPMEDLNNDEYLTIAVPGPGRSGKTAIGENWLLQSVTADPADMLWYEPINDVVESYVKSVINPMIDAHDGMKARLGPLPLHRSLHFKWFSSGMHAEFLAMTENNLRNKSAGRIMLDEMDAAPETLGDIYAQVDLRRQTFGRQSKVLAVSHPDLARGMDPAGWNRGIMSLYARSTRCCWYWPCPNCNDFSSPNPIASRVTQLHYPEDAPLDEIREAACLICPSCGGIIPDSKRRAMNIDGRWVGLGQSIAPDGTVEGDLVRRDIAGYWIVGMMSPFILGGLGALAEAKVAAERRMRITGEDRDLATVMARRFGWPHTTAHRANEIDAETLAARAVERPLGIVPEGVRFLTAFVDIQNARFELLVRGWGEHGESWIVDVGRIVADTAVSPAAWDDLLNGLLDRAYPLAGDPARAMRIRAIGYDSGGAPGVTQQAYAAWRRLRAARKAKFLGKMDGRHVWNVMPLKGLSGPNAARLQVTYPNSKRRDRDARATGAEPLILFNPSAYKDDLSGQLARGEPGPWYVHYPAVLRDNWPDPPVPGADIRHVWFEQVVAERQDHRGRWVRRTEGAPNEALDQHVGCHVLAELHGLSRIKWDKPPSWAAPWSTNSQVAASTSARRALGTTPAHPASGDPPDAGDNASPPSALAQGTAGAKRNDIASRFRGFSRRLN